MTLFQYSIYTFSAFNPAKRFASFTYQVLDDFSNCNSGDCQKGTILKINGVYYRFSGEKTKQSLQGKQSKIIFKDGRKVLAEIYHSN